MPKLVLVAALSVLLLSPWHHAAGEESDRQVRILFDHTKGQTLGNADWVVDDDEPIPFPAEPASERDWTGAFSAWGYELYATGRFTVHTLPRKKGKITYQDPSNSHDLSLYDVFVIPEPNITFTQAEVDALEAFVKNGGGLFLLANHCRSDRNSDGYDPPHILNQLTAFTGLYFNEIRDGNTTCWFSETTRNVSEEPLDPIVNGEHGRVRVLELHGSTSMLLREGENPSVRGHIWRKGASRGERTVIFATAEVGKGRVAAIGDSSLPDDGTGHPGKRLFPNWKDASHRILFLNATEWLAGKSP